MDCSAVSGDSQNQNETGKSAEILRRLVATKRGAKQFAKLKQRKLILTVREICLQVWTWTAISGELNFFSSAVTGDPLSGWLKRLLFIETQLGVF